MLDVKAGKYSEERFNTRTQRLGAVDHPQAGKVHVYTPVGQLTFTDAGHGVLSEANGNREIF